MLQCVRGFTTLWKIETDVDICYGVNICSPGRLKLFRDFLWQPSCSTTSRSGTGGTLRVGANRNLCRPITIIVTAWTNARAREKSQWSPPSLLSTARPTRAAAASSRDCIKALSPRLENRRRFILSGEWTDLAARRRLHRRHISTLETVCYNLQKLRVDVSPLSSILRCICPSDNHAGCSSDPCSGSLHW